MSKCGKGCLPECEYFTTCGCISPFNCAYKIEEYNQNTVFTNGDINNLSGIEKFFINTVKNGALPQEPMNYDGAAMKAYISYLENENERLRTENAKIDEYKCVIDNISKQCEELKSENAELKARLKKAVELPYMEKCNEYTKIIYKNNYGDIEDETYFHDCFYGENKDVRGDIYAETRFTKLSQNENNKENTQ